MTVTIELEDQEVERLLKILNENAQATEKTDAVRWTPESASRIENVKQKIEPQIE